MRCILVVLEGLGDKGYDVFGGKAPLQAARTPFLDGIAAVGINGLYHSALHRRFRTPIPFTRAAP